jgi:hypothetical protein
MNATALEVDIRLRNECTRFDETLEVYVVRKTVISILTLALILAMHTCHLALGHGPIQSSTG